MNLIDLILALDRLGKFSPGNVTKRLQRRENKISELEAEKTKLVVYVKK